MKLLDFIKLFVRSTHIRIFFSDENTIVYEGTISDIPWYLTECELNKNKTIFLSKCFDAEPKDISHGCLVVEVIR